MSRTLSKDDFSLPSGATVVGVEGLLGFLLGLIGEYLLQSSVNFRSSMAIIASFDASL